MDEIDRQLREYAQRLRDQGVPRERAAQMLSSMESRLRGQAESRPQQRTAEGDEEGLTASQRARLLGQGALFGFGEELEGLVRGAAALVPGGKSPREAYRETVERAREDIEQAYERAPVQSFATEMAGGIAPSVLSAPFTGGGSLAALGARGAALAPRAATAARTARNISRASAARPIIGGAAEGAISGAGVGETTGERALGAAGGAVLGGATGGLFKLGGAVGRRGREFAENVGLQREAARRSAGARAAGIPMSEEEAFAELVAERRPPIPTRAAVERVSEALLGQGIEPRRASEFAREGQTIMELGVPVSELRAMEAGMLPGSAAASPIQRIARGLSVAGDQPAERIRAKVGERLAGSPDRVKGELTRRALHLRSPYLKTLEGLENTRKANAARLYEAAYDKSIPAPALARFISRPEKDNWFVGTYREAQDLARSEVAAGMEGARELPEIFRAVQKNGETVYRTIQGARVPVWVVDYVQRFLGDKVDDLFRKKDISRQRANVLKFERENLLDVAANRVPEFAEARRIYRDDSANLQALNAAYNGGEVMIGKRPVKMRRFLEEKPATVRRFLASDAVSDSEKHNYITGALESLLEKAESTAEGRDLTRVLIGNKAMSDKVKLLLGSEENFRGFLTAILPERGLKGLEARGLGGSPTAEKMADVGRGLEAGTSVLTGQPGLAARLFAGVIDENLRKFTEKLRGKARRATEAELLTMSPKMFEEFYRDVYEPMSQPGALSIGSEALRRALGGQLSRSFMR